MQLALFQTDDQTVNIGAIAAEVGASEASVRNWIKTGYLQLDSKNRVTKESYIRFKEEVIGSEKLNKRANKKFFPDPASKFSKNATLAELTCPSAIYEKSLPVSVRNVEGIFYTPDHITDQFFCDLPEDRENLTFFDPCCGTGNFLVAAIRNGFSIRNIFGVDTDQAAINIAHLRLSQFPDFDPSNVQCRDFLQGCNTSDMRQGKFDVIITNPPWGKKLPKTERELFGRALGAGKSIDTCSLFFLAALKQLEIGGFGGFLLPESFFNVAVFESVRRRALELNLISVSDYGKPFFGLVTRAVGIIIRNTQILQSNLSVRCSPISRHGSYVRQQDQFSRNPNSIINFNCTEDEARTIDHIMGFRHCTLKGRARWGLGIVTGNNSRYVKGEHLQDYIPVCKGSDIALGQIKIPSSFIPMDLSLYQQVAPLEMYTAPEKLIYKFISNELVFFHDKEQRFVLNSANILIPDIEFKFDQKYLSEYLSSRIVNWMFKSIFGTHKILRSDLERLPLFLDFMEFGRRFCEIELCSYLGVEEARNGTFRLT